MTHDFFKANSNGPDVVAHRGGGGEWPGETIYAFERAAKLGVDVLEMDVRRTKDDQLVLMHNRKVNETTNGQGLVRRYTREAIQDLNAAARWSVKGQYKDINVGSLEDLGRFLTGWPDIRLNIEIKGPWNDVARKLGGFISECGLEKRVLVASAWPNVLNTFRRTFPKVATSASVPEIWMYQIVDLILNGRYRPHTDAIQWHSRVRRVLIITRRFVEKAHDLNLKVHAWTVNKPEEMGRVIELGVDGIITDYPTTLMKILGRIPE